MDNFDRLINAYAAAHHGLITRAIALELGVERTRISRRLKSGAWVRVANGVYRIAAVPETAKSTMLASVLQTSSDSWAGRQSAAALHGLPGFDLLPARIVIPRTAKRRPDGPFDAAQSLHIPSSHVTEVDAIPCTTVARTLFDLCGAVHPYRAERAIDDALVRKLATPTQLWHVLLDLAEHGRKGTVMFRELLMERSDGRAIVESELEAAFLRLCRAHALPEPERQVTFGDDDGIIGRVDFFFRPWKLVVECDGRIWHTAKLDRDRDAARDKRLRALGLVVERCTWSDVVRGADATAATLRSFGARMPR
ncbi:MAG: type IV toxin-antitoxin system AbiEi family antitoxin domain-containing protein [Acidimicrobiia bacterium]